MASRAGCLLHIWCLSHQCRWLHAVESVGSLRQMMCRLCERGTWGTILSDKPFSACSLCDDWPDIL